ncbi:hypothetical protein PENTCL1PPCAC_29731 [Pristionchus entomophagus]|uniref:Tetraspanin n=1 Tax=Pristionchus entomophagus TaxID=358040 RepID=A0AAV5UMP1_9BILA|nr:hypothetical protein PENTCL1PPCAC_29731 [Pristionchus entomophagus]
MAIRREGGDLARMCLIGFNVFLWGAGIALIIIGIWMLVDPTRSYILDLVNFSEDDPLLVFASYTCIFTGISTLFVGFVSCCGAMKRMRCMLTTLIVAMVLLFICGVAIGVLGLLFKNKAQSSTVTATLRFMIRHEYGVLTHLERNERVTALVDKMQYHLECCGVASHRDWKTSNWAIDGGGGEEDGRALYREQPSEYLAVPHTCCKQVAGSSALNPVPRSIARCQYTEANRLWRHQSGCGPKLYRWFSDQTTIFAVVGFSFSALNLIGIIIALCMCSQVRYYHYVKSEVY